MEGKHFDIRRRPDTTTGNRIACKKSMFKKRKRRKVKMNKKNERKVR